MFYSSKRSYAVVIVMAFLLFQKHWCCKTAIWGPFLSTQFFSKKLITSYFYVYDEKIENK